MRKLERFENLVAMFFHRAVEKGAAPFLWRKADDRWSSQSWRDVAETISSLAQGLKSIGINRGDRVMLVSENRPEWLIADLAIMAAGGITVPAYVTNTERDHQHILDNSGAKAVIVSSAKLAKPLLPAVLRSNSCNAVIGIEDLRVGQSGDVGYHDWSKLIAAHPADVAATRADADFARGDLACIIYTSGTGGAPRGVQQHHGAILHNVNGCCTIP